VAIDLVALMEDIYLISFGSESIPEKKRILFLTMYKGNEKPKYFRSLSLRDIGVFAITRIISWLC